MDNLFVKIQSISYNIGNIVAFHKMVDTRGDNIYYLIVLHLGSSVNGVSKMHIECKDQDNMNQIYEDIELSIYYPSVDVKKDRIEGDTNE